MNANAEMQTILELIKLIFTSKQYDNAADAVM